MTAPADYHSSLSFSGVLMHALGDCTVSRNSAAVRAVTERSKHRSAPISGGPVPCGVALDRPARPSGLGRICNWFGPFAARRDFIHSLHVCQDPANGMSKSLKPFRLSLLHVNEHVRRMRQSAVKA